MLTKSRAIVLQTLKYNDKHSVCRMLTEELGCVAFFVPVSQSSRAKIRPSLLQPLARVDIEWNAHARDGLERLRSLKAHPFLSIPYQPEKATVALFLAEFLDHALRKEPTSASLFNYIWQSLEWYDTSSADYSNFHLVFLLRFSILLGLFPNMENYEEGNWFDLRNGVFTTQRPPHPHALSPELATLLPKLMRMQYASMHLFRFSGQQRSLLLQFVNDFYRLHIPAFPELRSLSVLREVFG